MKHRLCKNSLAAKQRLVNPRCQIDGPCMILIVLPRKGNDEARVRDASHDLENPLRAERSGGPPLITPAWRRNRFPPLDLAFSICSRTSRPIGIPVRREVSFSQERSSSVRRIVSV